MAKLSIAATGRAMQIYNCLNESKCNLLKVSSKPLRACQEGDNDIAISQMLPDQQPDKLSVSVARQVAPCALGLRWLAASVSRILVVQD